MMLEEKVSINYSFIPPYYPIDAVGLEERAKSFTTRSIKKESKLDALFWIVKMMDLTTLEGADTPGKVEQLCQKAKYPFTPRLQEVLKNKLRVTEHPHVAAVCVYPEMVPHAVKFLKGSEVKIASVATSFPSGQLPLDLKLKEVERAIKFGANEIDMVIDRGAFLMGNYEKVFKEISKVKEVCEEKARLKVILETGELKTYDKVRAASWLAMEAGADFIKTSTGKVEPAATLPVTLVMLQAIYDYHQATGKIIAMKPAGGIKTAKQAIHYLIMVKETLGNEWLSNDLFRFGASSLLGDVLRQIYFRATNTYADFESIAGGETGY